MDRLNSFIDSVNAFAWGPPMLGMLGVTGVLLTLGLVFMPCARSVTGFTLLFDKSDGGGEGEVKPFNALMTALSATVGTGNIAGVATAIALGGPGAIFYMWLIALFGMATKYAEAVVRGDLPRGGRQRHARGRPHVLSAQRRGRVRPRARQVAGVGVRRVRRGGGLRHRQRGAGQLHGHGAGGQLRRSHLDHRADRGGAGRGRDHRRHPAHRRGGRQAGAGHDRALHRGGPDRHHHQHHRGAGRHRPDLHLRLHAGGRGRGLRRGGGGGSRPLRGGARCVLQRVPAWDRPPSPTRRHRPTARCGRGSSPCWGPSSTPSWSAP